MTGSGFQNGCAGMPNVYNTIKTQRFPSTLNALLGFSRSYATPEHLPGNGYKRLGPSKPTIPSCEEPTRLNSTNSEKYLAALLTENALARPCLLNANSRSTRPEAPNRTRFKLYGKKCGCEAKRDQQETINGDDKRDRRR